ncbi:hypothetical protein [Granulicella sp. dw_53]|uniref:hypothetical protein n=1 Tax=Granulicella sp. dw_53 TaxID=2719792 RepID=UPI001BD33EF0|nr:hypothetical protein [Granulicella sp. dw_53]
MSRRFLPLLLLAFLATGLASSNLHAQSRLAIYGTGGFQESGLSNQGWIPAGILGLYAGASDLGPLAISVDVRGIFSSDAKSVLVGPRLALHFPAFPLKPYSEILIGGTSYSRNGASGNFNASYVGGIDTAILPHVDWRLFDFTYRLNESGNGSSDHQKALTTGFVIRF